VQTAIWLFVRDPQKLGEIEREDLTAFCQASAPLNKASDLLQDFFSMVHQREGQRLDAWLAGVAESGLSEIQSFAAGVEKDKDAVKAGLTWPVNNGQVEGQVTKLKLIKRTMYGRAGFPLLRQRVLHAPLLYDPVVHQRHRHQYPPLKSASPPNVITIAHLSSPE
jgi:transposase